MTSRFWHGLNYPLMTALAGGLFLIIQTIVGSVIPSHPVLAAALATAVVAPLFLPLQEAIGRLVNRLVGSSPPTAYHVLADLTALSGAMSAECVQPLRRRRSHRRPDGRSLMPADRRAPRSAESQLRVAGQLRAGCR
jgi:hypothetical protein